MLNNLFSSDTLQEAWRIIQAEFAGAVWETVYVTILSTLFSILIGLPLGVLLVVGEKNGILPLPSWLLRCLNVVINLLRSVPAYPFDCRYGRGNDGVHRAACDCRVSFCRKTGRKQLAGGEPEHNRNGKKHGRFTPADHREGYDTRICSFAHFKRHNRDHDHSRVFGDERYYRRGRFRKNRHQLWVLPIQISRYDSGCYFTDSVGSDLPKHWYKTCCKTG